MDPRPLVFFRLSFGALMLVYSAGRCSDDVSQNRELGMSFYSFEYRVPSFLFDAFVRYFPLITHQNLYWEFHAPLMLLCAAGITLGYGIWSRISSFLFAVLKMALTLQTQHTYNNHEYLYALIALALGLVDCHDMRFSFVGKVVMGSLPDINANKSTGNSVPAWISLATLSAGCVYMMLQNAVYGIAGRVAAVGMCIFIWPAIVLLLGQPETITRSLSPTAPVWHAALVQTTMASVYMYAGVAKTSTDWLSGATARELMKLWTGPTAPTSLKDMVLHGGCGRGLTLVLSWGGAMLDLLAPLGLNFGSLSVKLACAGCLVGFHLCNHYLFVIETFPWVMLSALALQFNAEWMEYSASLVTSSPKLDMFYLWYPIKEAHNIIFKCMEKLRVIAVLILLLLLLLVPLPCALHSIGEDGSLTWGSQCSYWSWRMMTRSTRVLSVGLSLTNDSSASHSGKQQQRWIQESGLRGVWQEAAPYEDRFAAVLEQHERATAHKYADVWLEVNGPPFQRYIDPSVDLNGPLGGLHAPLSYWQSLLRGPAPLANWVLPRITSVRTDAWRAEFTRLEQKMTIVAMSVSDELAEVVFLADLAGGPSLHLTSDLGSTSASMDCSRANTFEIQLLSGQATILNVETAVSMKKGACVRFQGDLFLRADGPGPAVWKVVMTSSKNKEDSSRRGACAAASHRMLRARSHIAHAPMSSPWALHVTAQAPGPAPFRYCTDLNI